METLIKIIVGIVFAIIAIPLFCLALALGIMIITALFLAWVCGSKIEIKKKDKVLGHVRWFTFYPR
jgi:hypothetical protein